MQLTKTFFSFLGNIAEFKNISLTLQSIFYVLYSTVITYINVSERLFR